VRERVLRASDDDFDAGEYADEGHPSRIREMMVWLLRRPVDSFAALIAAGCTVMILVNALFLQSGPHPAPIFANKPPVAPAVVSNSLTPADTALPRQRPADLIAEPLPPARPRGQVVADIQRELSKRGFFEGSADGFYGPKTDAAIRDFEQAAGLRPSNEVGDALLQSILRSPLKSKAAAAAPKKNDPIAGLLASDPKVMAVQRALSSYGYGQIKQTGVYDPETRAAIEQFERERKLPVTGRVSDRLSRELTALTGRPLD
jgi:peptidoglycan hydrolase-like protein with peptidoglycan-binding domain